MILINFEPSVAVGHHGMHTVTHLITGIHLMVCPREPLERPLSGWLMLSWLAWLSLESYPILHPTPARASCVSHLTFQGKSPAIVDRFINAPVDKNIVAVCVCGDADC
jgi:hypothetical protein